jgi:hypothetical protein
VLLKRSASRRPVELAFFGYSLMRLGGAFDPILEFVTFGRQQLRNRIGAAFGAAEGPGCIIYPLPDLEFMVTHFTLAGDNSVRAALLALADLSNMATGRLNSQQFSETILPFALVMQPVTLYVSASRASAERLGLAARFASD